jgi:hypothetical protein
VLCSVLMWWGQHFSGNAQPCHPWLAGSCVPVSCCMCTAC